MLDDMSARPNSVDVDPFGLQPGEAEQVGRALAAALAVPAALAAPAAPGIDISGEWELGVSFLRGERRHRVQLRQQDGLITGTQSSHQFEGPVTGHVDGTAVRLDFKARHEGTVIGYRLDGSVADGRMQGHVTLGSATDHHQGPINAAQFGRGRFEGERREMA
jgi:hypothetical protein